MRIGHRHQHLGQTAAVRAVLANRPEQLKTLLELGANPNKGDREGRTPLWLAANRKRHGLVKLLLERGADPNRADLEGVVPLMKASNAAVMGMLLQAGARADVQDLQGRSVFQHFCRKPEALRRLVETLPSAQVPTEFRLWHCYQRRDRRAFEEICLENLPKLPIDRPVMYSQSVLWWAAGLGCLECCKRLCAAGWSPRRPDRDGQTALHIAIAADHTKVVKALVQLGAYLSGDGLPMSLARRRGNPQIIALLDSIPCSTP